MTSNRSVCLFCGSRVGTDKKYGDAAAEFGTKIALEGWRLVYGAGGIGLMGIAARSAKAAGGTVFGVIPKHLLDIEVADANLDTLIVTKTMHERKDTMFANSDAIVVLPGGPGTLDEFFEVLTWRHLGLHSKPIYILNCGGYWTSLLELVNSAIDKGFADEQLRGHFVVLDSVSALIGGLRKSLA